MAEHTKTFYRRLLKSVIVLVILSISVEFYYVLKYDQRILPMGNGEGYSTIHTSNSYSIELDVKTQAPVEKRLKFSAISYRTTGAAFFKTVLNATIENTRRKISYQTATRYAYRNAWIFSIQSPKISRQQDTHRRNYTSFLHRLSAHLRQTENDRVSKMKTLTQSDVYTKLLYVNRKKKNIINPSVYHYLINQPNACKRTNLSLLIYVHSAPVNFAERDAIRATWGNRTSLHKLGMVMVFFIGIHEDEQIMAAIEKEGYRHGDIIQENYDSYRNQSVKCACALKWIKFNCTDAPFILKMDDDVFANVYSIVDFLRQRLVNEYFNTDKLILCKPFHRWSPERIPRSKWFVTSEIYELPKYPAFCLGVAVLMSPSAASLMYDALSRTDRFWIHEVYMTGFLRQNAGVVMHSIRSNVKTHYVSGKTIKPERVNGKVSETMFVPANRTEMIDIWTDVIAILSQNRTKY